MFNEEKTAKFTIMWKLNNTLLNNQRVEEEIKGKIIKFLRQAKMKSQLSKLIGCIKSSLKIEDYNNN